MGGTRTNFHYSDEGLIGEYDAAGVEIKTYGYKPGSTWTTDPLFMKVGTKYYFYQNDHLGTPQKLTSTSGAVAWSAKYESFGEATVDAASTVVSNLRFAGQYYDQETGLHYNWHRYYDPSLGRYLSDDPIGLAAGVNLYAYVQNDPVNKFDPWGLEVLNPNNFPIQPHVQQALEDFNKHIGSDKDIIITGGDRPPTSNLGAGSGSQHTQGNAADIVVPGQTHLQTANQALDSGIFTGVGWYEEGFRGPNGEGPHVHVDLRPLRPVRPPAQWGYDKEGNLGRIPPYSDPCE